MILEPCDLYFTRGAGIISKAIQYFSHGEVNHVGMVVYGGSENTAIVVEALFTGVKRHRLAKQYRDKFVNIEIWRPINLTAENRETIVNAALSRVGEAYGYWDIGMQLLDTLLPREPYFFRRLGQIGRWSVCSCHIIQSFNFGGLEFGLDPNEGRPSDLRKFCKANPDKYQLIHKLKPIWEV